MTRPEAIQFIIDNCNTIYKHGRTEITKEQAIVYLRNWEKEFVHALNVQCAEIYEDDKQSYDQAVELKLIVKSTHVAIEKKRKVDLLLPSSRSVAWQIYLRRAIFKTARQLALFNPIDSTATNILGGDII